MKNMKLCTLLAISIFAYFHAYTVVYCGEANSVPSGPGRDYFADTAFRKEYRDAAVAIAKRKIAQDEAQRQKSGVKTSFKVKERLSTGGGFSGFFVWDSAFSVLWARYVDGMPVHGTLDNFYDLQLDDGFICREYDGSGRPMWRPDHPIAYNPPILAWAEIELYRSGKSDKARLERVYPKLVKFHACYEKNLKRPDGLYFSDILGGGMDDLPRWPHGMSRADMMKGGIELTKANLYPWSERFWPKWLSRIVPQHTWNRQAAWIDMSAQMAFDCLNLADIATAIGKDSDATAWRKEHRRIADLVNSLCWDEKTGFYYDRCDEGLIMRKHAGAFWVLLAKIPTRERARRIAAVMTDPRCFGRPIPLPALSADDPDYAPLKGYWQGTVWPPTTYVAICGLKAYGETETARKIARAWYNGNAKYYVRMKTVVENVVPEYELIGKKRRRFATDFCGWGALAPIAIPAEFKEEVRPIQTASPNGVSKVTFSLDDKGRPTYAFDFKDRAIVLRSRMGLDLKGNKEKGLKDGFAVLGTETTSFKETWKPVWGEESEITDSHNELLVKLKQKETGRFMNIRFRVFDDGLGFRYEFPQQHKLGCFTIAEERTDFHLPCDATAWWIPEDYYTQEYNYIKSRLSEIPGLFKKHSAMNNRSVGDKRNFPKEPGVQTAVQLKYDDGLYVNIHEAACIDYSTMHLRLNGRGFQSRLTPDAINDKGRLVAPCTSPWRTIIVGENGADILASRITLNLNEPCKIEDTSWIKPMKYIGVWWEMITGRSAWSYTRDFNAVKLGVTDYSKSRPHGRHGATTEHVMKYIDFAAAHKMGGVLVEGWNIGWEDWMGKKKDYVFDFVTPYPDFDLPKLRDYAKSKGVELVMHHETSSSTLNYERHLDKAYKFMTDNNYHRVKSGYVGEIQPVGELHYSQPMNNHYLYCITKAAEYKIMVNAHETTRPTGICRTWPNLIGNESARGTEYEAFNINNPGHTTILPFTRLIGGPMDYTPGIFQTNVLRTRGKNTGEKWMSSTLAGQLALYVTMFSPMPMAADLIENYEPHLDAFTFIEDVACDWDRSIYVEAEPGEVVTVVRKAKGSDDWFAGSKTNEEPHETKLVCDFLDADREYVATIYADAPEAKLRTPTSANYVITRKTVTKGSVLDLRSAPGGGWAISFRAK